MGGVISMSSGELGGQVTQLSPEEGCSSQIILREDELGGQLSPEKGCSSQIIL